MIERDIQTKCRVVTTEKNGKTRFLGWKGDIEFGRVVIPGETVLDCINRTFETYGLDTTDLDKIIEGLEDDGKQLIVKYRLEVDPLSLLEFLISEEGRDSGLELIDLEN